jgi:hypothetical protein
VVASPITPPPMTITRTDGTLPGARAAGFVGSDEKRSAN